MLTAPHSIRTATALASIEPNSIAFRLVSVQADDVAGSVVKIRAATEVEVVKFMAVVSLVDAPDINRNLLEDVTEVSSLTLIMLLTAKNDEPLMPRVVIL